MIGNLDLVHEVVFLTGNICVLGLRASLFEKDIAKRISSALDLGNCT